MLPFSPRYPWLFLLLTSLGLLGVKYHVQTEQTLPSSFASTLVTSILQRSPQGISHTALNLTQNTAEKNPCQSLISCAVSCETIAVSEPLPAASPFIFSPIDNSLKSQKIVAQGSWACVNDRPLSLPWIQIESQIANSSPLIAIQDFALEEKLGLSLLSSHQPQSQSVSWFSQLLPPSEIPLSLPIYLSDRVRYLSLVPLVEKGGWQAQIQSGKLQLKIPPAVIQSLRFARREQGYRVVLDLDRPAIFAVNPESDRWILQLDGSLSAPFLTPEFARFLIQDPIAKTLQWQLQSSVTSPQNPTVSPQVRLSAKLPSGLVAQVSSLSNPSRLVIDFQPRSFLEKTIAWAPGITWTQQWLNLKQKAFPLVYIRLHANVLKASKPPFQIRPLFPQTGTLAQLQSLPALAEGAGAIVAINAGFFNRNNQLPLGAIQDQGKWISGPILDRGAMAWQHQPFQILFDRLKLPETLITPTQNIPLTELNSGYVRGGIARYTSLWGASYQPLIDQEIVLSVVNHQVTTWQQLGKAGSTQIPIPANGYLLAARANATIARQLPVGTPLQIGQTTQPPQFQPYPQIVGAGPLLIRQGITVLDAAAEGFSPAFIQQSALRSAVGQTAQGDLLLVTIAATPGGAVPNLVEMAEIMQHLGTIDALNLDGGSSSSLYLGGKVLNRSPGTAARIHNALGIVYTEFQ